MEESKFDVLLRRAARQATRREALGALIGGALLLNEPDASDAAKKAKRRKRRRRKKTIPGPSKSISIRVYNPGTSPVTVQHGWWGTFFGTVCVDRNRIPIPPGENRLFQSPSEPMEYVWINDTFWVDFHNKLLARTAVTAAVDDSPLSGVTFGCPPRGTTVLSPKPMSVGDTATIAMDGHVFSARRNRVSNYKEFTLTLPATL